MMRQILCSFLSGFLLLLCVEQHAAAAELAGVSLPDTVEVEGETLQLNGMGIREATIFGIDVYVAGLYLQTKSSDPETILSSREPKQLIMHFVRDVKRDSIVDAWNEGFAKNSTDVVPQLQERIDAFNALMTDMKKGQSLIVVFNRTGVELRSDQKTLGNIEGEDFSRALLAIWLGPKPPNSGLKKGLLGG